MKEAKRVQTAANRLRSRRASARIAEMELQEAVAAMISAGEISLSDWARQLKVSPPYASDIRAGNRGISDVVLERLAENAARKAAL